jgi:SAM-dependent methyltransferase
MSSKNIHPSLEFLISNVPPNTSRILEVGCGNGNNLQIISSFFPDIYLEGFDPNIQKTNKSKVVLSNGSAPEYLKNYGDKAFDLVFTRSVLMYIQPHKIEKTLNESFRVGKRCLFIEQDGSKLALSDRIHLIYATYRNLWSYKRHTHLYNYERLLRRKLGIEAKVSPLPFTWGDLFWDKYGVVVSI